MRHFYSDLDIVSIIYGILGSMETQLLRSVWHHSDMLLLTGDSDSGLAALGRPQVTPGHTQTPVILRAVEVLHLLTRHVDQHLADLQSCGHTQQGGRSLKPAFITSWKWSITQMKLWRGSMIGEIWSGSDYQLQSDLASLRYQNISPSRYALGLFCFVYLYLSFPHCPFDKTTLVKFSTWPTEGQQCRMPLVLF